jgi:hypothetical protein
VTAVARWLDRHTGSAPAPLRDRVRAKALARDSAGSIAHTLAEAGWDSLGQVLAHAGDRSAALDLLAADALVTLALLAQAEADPEQLAEFAASLLGAIRPDA